MARDRGIADGSPPGAHGASRARRPAGAPAPVGGDRGDDLGQDLGPRSRLRQAVGKVRRHAFGLRASVRVRLAAAVVAVCGWFCGVFYLEKIAI